ncbi:MAG TPA: hypothetical protein VMS56_03380 [Thermoanaerobaculia bacterium]|nr:hypothetical protein [Thermoanaerobaculia bacterium]
MSRRFGSLPFWFLYPLWICICALLFAALQAVDVEDPSRRDDRILSREAGRIALRILRGRDADRFADYDVVNVAWARPREVAADPRWIVLLDRNPRTGLEEALVIELEPRGELIRIREVFRE